MPPAAPDESQKAELAEPTRADVQQLMDQALTTPTLDSLQQFVDFANRFRKLAAYNLYMVYIQRPGAAAVATRDEWMGVGQTIMPDAVPIVILRTFGPIELVYELSDTAPPQVRDPRSHMLGAEGPFDVERMNRLVRNLKPKGKALRIDVVQGSYGAHLAGTAAAARPLLTDVQDLASGTLPTGQIAHGNFETTPYPAHDLLYRIKLNRRMTAAEQFTTLAHELGHIFCGHLGAFLPSGRADDDHGWPDRSSLGQSAREIEAELVAWLIASRANLITGAPIYLRPYLERARDDGSIGSVSPHAIIRAAARIERLSKR